MNNLQKELNALKEKIADLESRISAEPVKWQPKGGDWWIDEGGEVFAAQTSSPSKEFGTERATQEKAKRAAVEMRRFNRLLALRDELCGDEVVGLDDHKTKHYVYFSPSRAKWFLEFNNDYGSLNPYFTNRDAAQKACNMLNSGEVEL